MTAKPRDPADLVAIATVVAGLALLASHGFEQLMGLRPCDLCHLQRNAHAGALGVGLLALSFRKGPLLRWIALLGALVAAFGGLVAAYQVGLEQGWWEGFTACSAPIPPGLSADQLIERLKNAPVVRCDEVQWSLLGISMAGWNIPLSAGLAWLFGRAYASSSASQ